MRTVMPNATTSPTLRPPTTPELASRLRITVARLARLLRNQAETGVSPSQLSALASLDNSGRLTLGELAAAERVQPPTMTRIVAALEEAGLVTRTVDAADRRVARVELTPSGRTLLERARAKKNAYLARKLRDLDPDQIATVEAATAILERFLEDKRR
jgi:DNA-binding MarR family transcriptional regulator